MQNEKFSVRKRIKSFKYAINGIRLLFKDEHNARIHLFATICVVSAGFVFEISTAEWIAVTLCIGIVIAMEAINSSIESLADFVSPAEHYKIMKTKDLAAAAVLIAAISAAIVGLIIFVPKVIFVINKFFFTNKLFFLAQ